MYTNFEMLFPHNNKCFNGMCYVRDGKYYIYVNDKYIPVETKFKPDRKINENILSNGLHDYFGHFNYCDNKIIESTYHQKNTYLLTSGTHAFVVTVIYLLSNGFNLCIDKNAYYEQKYLVQYLFKDKDMQVYGFEQIPDIHKTAYICSSISSNGERKNIRKLADDAHSKGGVLVVDNTYMTSMQYNPFFDGADIVIDSTGKYYTSDFGIPSGLMVYADKGLLNTDIIDCLCRITCSFAGKNTAIALKNGIKTIADKLNKIQRNAKWVNDYLIKHGVATKFPNIGGVIWIYNRNVTCHNDFKVIQPNDAFGLSHTVYTVYVEESDGTLQYVLRLSCGVEDPKEYISDLQTIINANG